MPSDLRTPADDLARTVGAVLQADPERVSRLVSSLRGHGRSIESTVEGMSMRGCLAPGSRIRIELAHNGRYDSGNVVAFLAAGQLIVHRVVYRGTVGPAAGLFLTRGDAPVIPDRPVSHAQILGRVTSVFEHGRWVAPDAITPRSWRASVAAASVLWAAIALLHLSPRMTAMVLARLHRLEGAARRARSRRQQQLPAAPRRTQ